MSQKITREQLRKEIAIIVDQGYHCHPEFSPEIVADRILEEIENNGIKV